MVNTLTCAPGVGADDEKKCSYFTLNKLDLSAPHHQAKQALIGLYHWRWQGLVKSSHSCFTCLDFHHVDLVTFISVLHWPCWSYAIFSWLQILYKFTLSWSLIAKTLPCHPQFGPIHTLVSILSSQVFKCLSCPWYSMKDPSAKYYYQGRVALKCQNVKFYEYF